MALLVGGVVQLVDGAMGGGSAAMGHEARAEDDAAGCERAMER